MNLPTNFDFSPEQEAAYLMYCFVVASLIGLVVHSLQIVKYQRWPHKREEISLVSWAFWSGIWMFGSVYYLAFTPNLVAGGLPLVNLLLCLGIAGYAMMGHFAPVQPEERAKLEVEYQKGYEKTEIANLGHKVPEVIEKAWPCKKGEKIEHSRGYILAPFDGIAIISNKTDADIPRFVTIKQYQAIRGQKIKPVSR